jgi:hypothetical protein
LPSINIRIKIQRTIILPVVLYGYKALKQEHRLRVFENRVLRKDIRASEGQGNMEIENTGRASQSVLLTKYYSGNHTKKNEMDGACSTHEERRSAHRVLVVKPEGKRLLGRPRHR